MNKPRSENKQTDIPVVPVVMPHVLVVVDVDGSMLVTVNDQAYDPPQFAPPWDRNSFATVIDGLLTTWRCALRVEVHESDGATFTDIITPRKHRDPDPEATPSPVAVSKGVARFALHTVTGEGFIPGEDVAVAVVVGHGHATNDGVARAILTAEQLADSPTGEVVLFGRVSGTITVGRPA
jgi:hypothetical protein